jgi:hypothetical protein
MKLVYLYKIGKFKPKSKKLVEKLKKMAYSLSLDQLKDYIK